MGECVGTFIGENPGGAQSIHGLAHVGYSPIEHRGKPGDPTLRLLLGIWQHASSSRGFQPQRADYVEVLNTYYFRDTKSGHALSAWRDAGGSVLYFQNPCQRTRFVILGWGSVMNSSEEARCLAHSVAHFPRVVIPNSTAHVSIVRGSTLSFPLNPFPVSPSAILTKSKALRPSYVANLARAI